MTHGRGGSKIGQQSFTFLYGPILTFGLWFSNLLEYLTFTLHFYICSKMCFSMFRSSPSTQSWEPLPRRIIFDITIHALQWIQFRLILCSLVPLLDEANKKLLKWDGASAKLETRLVWIPLPKLFNLSFLEIHKLNDTKDQRNPDRLINSISAAEWKLFCFSSSFSNFRKKETFL
jgi:hypothetical protein